MLRSVLKMLLILMVSIYVTMTEAAWGTKNDKKVKLKDVDVLTLYHGKMTNGRRSSPVLQLECLSVGSAPCSAFIPKVVQCMNKGSDGYDVQWECKTDMDNAYRFGEIDVSCEGFDYPDDPYILHGSCGLKYSLDYTSEGASQGSYNHYGNNNYDRHQGSTKSTYSIFADLIVYVGIGLMIYAFYKTCIVPSNREGQPAYSSTNDDYPSGGGGGGGGGGGYGWFGGNQAPPPQNGYRDDASCRNRTAGTGGMGGGGFWTGAATGGLLGYMFGNRGGGWGGTGNGYGYGNRARGYSSGGFSSGGGSSFSGARSASGFGGTSRR